MANLKCPKEKYRKEYLEFLEDIGFRTNSKKANINKFLGRRGWIIQYREENSLSYFVVINRKNNQVKYYSKAISRFELKKSNIKIMIKTDYLGLACMNANDISLYNYNQMRESHIPKLEIIKNKKKKEALGKKRIDRARFEFSLDVAKNDKDLCLYEISQKLRYSIGNYVLYNGENLFWLVGKTDKKTKRTRYLYRKDSLKIDSKTFLEVLNDIYDYKVAKYKDFYVITYFNIQDPLIIKDIEDISKTIEIYFSPFLNLEDLCKWFVKIGYFDKHAVMAYYKNFKSISYWNVVEILNELIEIGAVGYNAFGIQKYYVINKDYRVFMEILEKYCGK